MAGTVKGITIEFKGDTTQLSKAINQVRAEARSFDKELSAIDRSLKFNPKSVDLMKQKIAVLSDATKAGEKNIAEMKKALETMKNNGVSETSAEYRELEREIIKAEDKQKRYNAELNKLKAATSTLGRAGAAMQDFGSKATKAGEALRGISAAAAGIDVALAGLAYKSGQAADELNTMAKVTGISTQELQKYKAASDLVDVSVETIAKSQTKLKKNMLSAAQGFDTLTVAEDGTVTGGNAVAEAFQTLGVEVTDSTGHLRSQDEVFTETIKALGKMENETERDAIAMQIFGKSATELNPLIEDNGETYKRVADIFAKNDLELVDQETIDKANKFNDTIDEIKATGMAALSSIGMQLAGYLQPALEKIAGAIEKVFSWLSKLDPEVLTIIGIIAGVVAGLAPVLIIIGKLATAIGSIMSLMSTLGVSIGAIAGPVGIAIAAIAAIIAIGVLLYKNWDKIKAKATEIKNWVSKKWIELKTSVTNTVNAIKTKVTTVWNNIKTTVSNVVNSIKASVANAFTNLKNTVSSIFNTIKAVATGAWNGVKYAITHPIDAAVSAVRIAINKIKGFFSGLKLKLPNIKLPHFKLTGTFSLMPPSVPKISIDWYKNGGIFTQPTIFGGVGVGEAGAEAVLPLKKLWEEMDKRYTTPAPVTINVYAPQGMNVNQLAEEVQRRLVMLQKQKARAY